MTGTFNKLILFASILIFSDVAFAENENAKCSHLLERIEASSNANIDLRSLSSMSDESLKSMFEGVPGFFVIYLKQDQSTLVVYNYVDHDPLDIEIEVLKAKIESLALPVPVEAYVIKRVRGRVNI